MPWVTVPLTVCPWNVLMGLSCPSLQTWIHMSVLQEANVLLLCQSTSRAGAAGVSNTEKIPSHILTSGDTWKMWRHQKRCFLPEWKGNCCLASPVWASHMIVVWRDTNSEVRVHDDCTHICLSFELILVYLVYACTQDKIALFIPLQGKDGTFVLAKCTGQVSCKEIYRKGDEIS